jgi:hypothetical protein
MGVNVPAYPLDATTRRTRERPAMTHTKDEALKLRLADAIRNERHNNVAETRYWCDQYKQIATEAVAAQPAPVQPVAWTAPEQCDSPEICRIGRACADQFGTQKKCTTQPAQPAVPDAIHHTDLSEHPQYIEGWNDCRAEMLKGMKP